MVNDTLENLIVQNAQKALKDIEILSKTPGWPGTFWIKRILENPRFAWKKWIQENILDQRIKTIEATVYYTRMILELLIREESEIHFAQNLKYNLVDMEGNIRALVYLSKINL